MSRFSLICLLSVFVQTRLANTVGYGIPTGLKDGIQQQDDTLLNAEQAGFAPTPKFAGLNSGLNTTQLNALSPFSMRSLNKRDCETAYFQCSNIAGCCPNGSQ